MTKYDKILRGGRAGVYAAPRLAGPLRAAAKRAGIAWYDLDLKGAVDRETLLQHCAAVFSLPPWFGGNFDALHECLVDMAGRGWSAGRAVTEVSRRLATPLDPPNPNLNSAG